jgi:hypothetical protein
VAALGRVVDAAPDADALLSARPAALVALSPWAALSYAARLAQVAAAAGRPLAAVRALSCYSLNGGRHRALYDATANLLHYTRPARQGNSGVAVLSAAEGPVVRVLGPGAGGPLQGGARAARAGLSSDTAVSKWVHDADTAPHCDPYASPHDRPGLIRRSRIELTELQAAAGLWLDAESDPDRGGLRRAVCWDGGVSSSRIEGSKVGSGGLGPHQPMLGGVVGTKGSGTGVPTSACPMLAYLWV